MHGLSRRRWLLWLALIPLVATAANDSRTVALQLLDRLDRGEYAEAVADFTPDMLKAVPATQIQQIWASLPQQLGKPLRRGDATVTPANGMELVMVPLYYERGALTANIAVTPDGRIAGLRLLPLVPPPPAVPDEAGYTEQDLQVGDQPSPLPATLVLPGGEGEHPAVVLVHGSGPQNRDETIGPNHIFLELARGLGKRGIAVLRYDKRTHVYPEQFKSGGFTMEEETVADAVAAVDVLRQQPRVDPSRVFVLGHSQGGMLAPRIAGRVDDLAGVVLFAAPARSLLDLLPEQNRYLFGLDQRISEDERAFLNQLDEQIAALRGDGPVATADTPMQLPAVYWRDADAVDPVAEAAAIEVPMLLLQGGRDFQVTGTDWALWKDAFEGDPRATFRYYPALNHLGIAGQGASSLEEYQQPGHVEEQMITDIANWIDQVSGA